MKPIKVLIYLLVLAALAGYVYFGEIKRKQTTEEAEKKAKRIVHLDKDKVARIEILDGDKIRAQLDKPADKWVLSAPVKTKAESVAVQSLLQTLEGADAEKTVADKDVKWEEYGLDKPSFTVSASTPDKKISLQFGDKNPAKTSHYARLEGDPRLFMVQDTLKNALNKSVFDLREKSVLRIAETDVERLKISQKGQEVELERKDPSKWVVTKPGSFTAKHALASGAVRSLTKLKAKEIIDTPAKDSDPYGLDNPEEVITLAGPKMEQTLLLGKTTGKADAVSKAPDRYAQVKGEDTVYVLDGRSLNEVKSDPEILRDRSVLSFGPTDVDRMEIELDGKRYVAAQEKGNQWMMESPEKRPGMDAWNVTSVLWDIRDLEWKSLTKPAPQDLASVDLDKPRLIVSLRQKGDKPPVTLKAGWKSAHQKPDKDAAEAKAKEPPKTGAEPPAEGDQAAKAADHPATPETVYAIGEPTDEPGAVFALDGKFLDRLRLDLQTWTEKK